MNPALQAAFGTYLKERSLAAFLAVRDLLISLPSYDPWSPELAEFDRLLGAEDWGSICQLAAKVMDNWLLTPYLHESLALANKKLGDESRSALEAELFRACAQGIMLTGDGSREHPYLAVRVDDAYGVVFYLGKTWVQERDERAGNNAFRVLRAPDGTEQWFDITKAAQHPKRLGS